jgi:hypothetical protein
MKGDQTMSNVFEGTTNAPENAPAATDQQQTSEDWVAKLAEQRGEKWTDPQVIAKGKLEADQHISNLEKQLQEMREDIAKQDYAAKVLEALQNKGQSTTGETAEPKTTTGDGSTQNTTDAANVDIESLVEQTLTKREREAKVAQNVQKVSEALEQQYGTEASKMVKQKADALGLSMARMQELAGESPDAFLTLIGTAPAPERNADVSSSVNTAAGAFNAGSQKNWKYYQEMRRKNPTQYYRPNVQNEMIKMREELGDRFYS